MGYHNGGVVRLQDVADVIDSQQTVRQAGFLNGKPSVNMLIFRQPGANIITTVDAVKAAIPSLQATIPTRRAPGHDSRPDADHPGFGVGYRAHAADLGAAGGCGGLPVSCGTRRATFIPAVAVPVSLIGTCAVMYLCGFSLDNLSLMALAIASGFVVDDAIVVMENITRHLEQGLTPIAGRAAGRAGDRLHRVFSISISLIAVFIPLLMMGGIIGRLFREFAITLSSAILVSMVVLAYHHADDVLAGSGAREARSNTAGCTAGASASSMTCSTATGAA